MRILHVIPSLAPRYGGPSTVAPEMCRALTNRGHEVEILTTDRDGRERIPVPTAHPVEWRGVATTFYAEHWPRPYATSLGLGAALWRRVSDFDVVHVHSLYLFPTLVAGHYCRRSDVPYLIRPHGTLDPYQRSKHKWRKALYTTLVERHNIDAAAGLHYTSLAERDHARSLGFRAPPFVVPLGVDTSVLGQSLEADKLLEGYPWLAGQILITFLGRLAHKKRLDLLLDAFARVASLHPRAHLVIAGPDDEGIGTPLRARISALGLRERVSLLSLVTGDTKAALLQHSRVFALPSEDENFAVSVVEAMATGVPVVVTPGVALHHEIEEAKAGLVVSLAVDALAAALLRLIEDEQLAMSLGRNGQVIAQSTFAWSRIAFELERMYYQAIEGRSVSPGP